MTNRTRKMPFSSGATLHCSQEIANGNDKTGQRQWRLRVETRRARG